MTLNINRRRVVAGAAWSVPAITVATAAPAFAATLTPTNPVEYQTLNVTVYSRVRTLVTTPVTNRTDGATKVDYTFIVPSRILAGASTAAQPIVYTSQLSAAATSSSYSSGARTVESGYVDTTYNFGGGALTGGSTVAPARMTLNPGNVAFPSSGRLSTRFTGTMPVLTASATPGTYAITFQNPAYEPVESDASTWNGTQTVVTNIFNIRATARVHSMIPTTVPSTNNDWGTGGQPQTLAIGTFQVV